MNKNYRVRIRGNCDSIKKINKEEKKWKKVSDGNCEHTIVFICHVFQTFKRLCTVRCL